MPDSDKRRARDDAAKLVGVSPRYVQDAKAISRRAPGGDDLVSGASA